MHSDIKSMIVQVDVLMKHCNFFYTTKRNPIQTNRRISFKECCYRPVKKLGFTKKFDDKLFLFPLTLHGAKSVIFWKTLRKEGFIEN